MQNESFDHIIKEHSEIRKLISDFFTKNYPEEVEKQVFDPIIEKAEEKNSIVDDTLLGETSLNYLDFLLHGTLPDHEFYTPLDVFSLRILKDKMLPLEEVLEIRKMYHTSYMGLFRFINYKNKNTIQLLNIISGEMIDLHPSDTEFELDEKLIGNFMLQQVETLKGHHFSCGNGYIFYANNIHGPLQSYKKSLPSLINCYYSSEENRLATYKRFQEDQKKFTKIFGQNPATFYDTNIYKQQFTDYLMKEKRFANRTDAESCVMKHPLTNEIPKLKNGLNVYANKQGLFFFTDFVTFLKYLPEFENTKNQKKREAFLDAFLIFMIGNSHPADIFFIYEEHYPKAIKQLLKEYNHYFDIKFPTWKTFIQFWFPQYPNETPINIEIPPRLKNYVWDNQKISRNDLCICGSEKKFKKCCGK